MPEASEKRRSLQALELAFVALGEGFVAHPDNTTLREALASRQLGGEALAQQLRSVLLRWCVLLYAWRAGRFVAVPSDEGGDNVSSRPLELGDVFGGWPLGQALGREGCWEAHCVWLRGFDPVASEPPLSCPGDTVSLPVICGELWELATTCPDLLSASLPVVCFQQVAGSLDEALSAVVPESLGEWLGDGFSRTLRLHPIWDSEMSQLVFREEVGSSRRSSGSYYTPEPLVEALLAQSLDPLLCEISQQPEPAAALLEIRVCDPSCGAGHFLAAAAKHIHRAAVQVGAAEAVGSDALWRQIVERCLYGVDLHPLATWLCRAHLWMLSGAELGEGWLSLRLHIRRGNSLLGADGSCSEVGIPDDAFRPLVGDDKTFTSQIRKRNQQERGSGALVGGLFQTREPALMWQVADAWCAAFVCPKSPGAPVSTNETLRQMLEGHAPPVDVADMLHDVAAQFHFFHWHLAFPEIFGLDGEGGGFDVILGNPPWERIKLQDKEYFAARIPAIAQARRAAVRREMIKALADDDPEAHAAYLDARRAAEATGRFLAASGLYPQSGRGDTNLYTCFVELSQRLIRPGGIVALLVPSGIATDHTTREYFQALVSSRALVSLYDFENRKRYFPDVSSRFRFCLLHLQGHGRARRQASPPTFLFFGQEVDDLAPEKLEAKAFSLQPAQIALLNPNTQTCPIFRTRRDASLTLSVYERLPILWDEQAETPPVQFLRMFDMTNDSGLFLTRDELVTQGAQREGGVFVASEGRYLPLYEGKMFDQYDHRCADVLTTTNTSRPGQPSLLSAAEHADPARTVSPQYWVSEENVERALGDGWKAPWLLAFKDVTSPTNSRTFIGSILPRVAVANSAPLLLLPEADGPLAACLCATINSFALDYIARQKISSLHMNYFIVKQLPFLPFATYDEPCPWAPELSLKEWLVPRVLSLVYTAHEMAPFARACGEDGEPHPWDEAVRLQRRCELDAAMFHLYGIVRDDVAYVMETFPIIKKRELEAYGEYRSKDLILLAYDELG